MNKVSIFLAVMLIALIILHLIYSIDYENLLSSHNKGGATGIMVCILGLAALWLNIRLKPGEIDVSVSRSSNED